jgi:hypothetical protein
MKMKSIEKQDLDNLFSRNSLGEIYLENPNEPGIWYTNEHDYVTIKVPYSRIDRFREFWRSARVLLEDRLQIYYMQEGTPLSDGYYIKETWYFITVDGARGMLEYFNEILPKELPGIRA